MKTSRSYYRDPLLDDAFDWLDLPLKWLAGGALAFLAGDILYHVLHSVPFWAAR